MGIDAYAALKQLVLSIIGNRDTAQEWAEDPYGKLTEYGITEGDLAGVNLQSLVQECAAGYDLPEGARNVLNSYTSGGPAPAHYPVKAPPPAPAHPQPADVVQHLNYVTYAVYEGDTHITQQITNQELYDYSTNIDNSTHVDIDGNVAGDITVAPTNVNATGDGAVANAGDGDVNAATGDGSQIIDGDNFGQANTGAGAVQVGDHAEVGAINTGVNTGILAGDDVTNAVVGDNNQSIQGSDVGAAAFGSGDATNVNADGNVNLGSGQQINVQDSDVSQSAFGGGNVTTTDINIQADDGAAVAFGEGSQAVGNNQDVDIHNQDGIVQVAGDHSTQQADQSIDVDLDVNLGLPAARTLEPVGQEAFQPVQTFAAETSSESQESELAPGA